MSTTGITIPHQDIVEELNAARMSYAFVDYSQSFFEHRVSPPGNTHGMLPHERQGAGSNYPELGAIDVERLKAAAERAVDEIVKLRAENARYSATIDRAILTLDKATESLDAMSRHRDDLLDANNRYLERAREAEAEIRRRDERNEDARQRVQDILRDKVTASSDLADTIAELGKFVDMIEARAMAVDGPVTPFCEELHAASLPEKERFQGILAKLYRFRNCWQMVTPAPMENKTLVTKEWVERKAALEGDLDCTTGARPICWRCFHCDEYFTSEHSARLHFGATDGDSPACQIKAGAEGSILEALRRAEADAERATFAMHEESTEGWKAFHQLSSRVQEQVRAAEELGYERGLKDGREEAASALAKDTISLPVAFMERAYECMEKAFHTVGLSNPNMYVSAARLVEIGDGFDSLDFVEMLIELEKTSGILIDASELPYSQRCTIGDLAWLLASKMAKGEKA